MRTNFVVRYFKQTQKRKNEFGLKGKRMTKQALNKKFEKFVLTNVTI